MLSDELLLSATVELETSVEVPPRAPHVSRPQLEVKQVTELEG